MKATRCKKCGSTKGRHYWFKIAGVLKGQCPERYQPGIISGIPSLYFEPAAHGAGEPAK